MGVQILNNGSDKLSVKAHQSINVRIRIKIESVPVLWSIRIITAIVEMIRGITRCFYSERAVQLGRCSAEQLKRFINQKLKNLINT